MPIVSKEYRERKKQQIFDSALVCFAKSGFENATVDDIVAYSGLSKGTIYTYFTSKDQIYLELMNQKTEESFNNIKKSIAIYNTAIEKIDYLFSIHGQWFPYDDNKVRETVVYLEFKMLSARKNDVNEILNNRRHEYFLKLLTSVIKEGQEMGHINTNCDPYVYSDLFWTMMEGLDLQRVYKDYPIQEIITEMKKMYLNMVKA